MSPFLPVSAELPIVIRYLRRARPEVSREEVQSYFAPGPDRETAGREYDQQDPLPGEASARNAAAHTAGALFCESCNRHHFHGEGEPGCPHPRVSTTATMRLEALDGAGHIAEVQPDLAPHNKSLRRQFLEANLAQIDSLLAEIPRRRIIERSGFEAQRDEILQELQTLERAGTSAGREQDPPPPDLPYAGPGSPLDE